MSEEPIAQPAEPVEEYGVGDAVGDFLLDVLDAMGIESDVETELLEDGSWRVEVVGADAGEIIGEHGEVINALQYLCGLVAVRQTGEHARIMLDADGYRARRAAALTEQARQLAEEVARLGQEAELDPLSPYERRIIHNALLDHPGVVTYSEGVEPERRVIIAPRTEEPEPAPVE
jgi:spoIIIJ-associated protein